MRRISPSEHQIQAQLVKELGYRMRTPVVRLSIPNGGLRNPSVGKMLKNEGLLAGSPDLLFALEDARVFWLELKRLGGTLSDAQIGIHHKLRALGHSVDVAFSVDEALTLLGQQGILR